MTRTLFLVLLFLSALNICSAQKFAAHIDVGFNVSQIDGDLFAGYNKIGLHGGVGVSYDINNEWSIETGLFYDGLGSQKELQLGNTAPEEQQKIKLTYVSVPLSAQYRLSSIPLSLGTGLQVSYLIESKIQDRTDDAILEFFNKTDFSIFVTASYRWSDRWSCSLKANEAISLIFNNDKVSSLNSNSLRNRYLTFSFKRHL